MDESMSTDSSFLGPSRGVGTVGIGISNPARPFPAAFPSPVAAYTRPAPAQAGQLNADPWAAHRARGEQQQTQQGMQYDQSSPEQAGQASEEQEEEEEGEEQGEEDEEMSEGSSADYDAEADPEGWAKRLDELAGVLEISEEEARAVRWGPALGPDRDDHDLPLADFKRLTNHHLAATDWKYASAPAIHIPGRPTTLESLDSQANPALHPIRVVGSEWIGAEIAGDGLPAATRND